MNVKNKVDEDAVENVVKEDTPTELDADKPDLAYAFGRVDGYLEGTLDSNKVAEEAKTTGILIGAGMSAIGYIVSCCLTTILSNKHHN